MSIKGLFDRIQRELEAREKTLGLTMADILDLPDDERALIRWILRQNQVTLAQVMDHLRLDEAAARIRLAGLIEQGFVREIDINGVMRYRVRLRPRRRPGLPGNLWQALYDRLRPDNEG